MERIFIDIYAILESTQELHFGHESEVNVNVVESVKVPIQDGEEPIEKLYCSPTKTRGVIRRVLLHKLQELGTCQDCGVPATCCRCELCRLYGGLIAEKAEYIKIVEEILKSEDEELYKTFMERAESLTKKEPRARVQKVLEELKVPDEILSKINDEFQHQDVPSIASRVIHAGGVAIEEIPPEVKQRLRAAETEITEGGSIEHQPEKHEEPVPFKKEYIEPGILFPTYLHAFHIDPEKGQRKMSEPQMIAYGFIMGLPRLGAGHPKGMDIYKEKWISEKLEPMLIVDIYKEPLAEKPIISPRITDKKIAIDIFKKCAEKIKTPKFERFIGEEAYNLLVNLINETKTESSLLEGNNH